VPLTVLIVAGGGFQGESLAESVRSIPDVRVVVADSIMDNLGRAFADRYVVCPPMAEATAFADCIESLVRDEHIDLVLPAVSFGLKQLAALRPRIESAGAILGLSSESLLDILLDKTRTYEALLDAGIPAQRPVLLTPDTRLPLCGKPRDGWGGRDLVVLKKREELVRSDIAARATTHCWVPWLDQFDEFSADFAINRRGACSQITLRRRVRTSGGFAVISDSTDDEAAKNAVAQTAHWLASTGGLGIFNVQILKLPDGTLYVSDVNPRHGTSSTHARGEGNPWLAFLAELPADEVKVATRSIRTLQQRVIPLPERDRWKGVVFDLDDTLIDHKRWMMDKLQIVANQFTDRVPATLLLDEAYAIVEEGHHERLIDLLAQRLALESLHVELLEAYRAAVPERAHLFPEVLDVLHTLRATGHRLGLLTDNPPASQKLKLQHSGDMAGLFDAIIFTRELGAEKPAHKGFLAVASQLGMNANQLLMVGDNPSRDARGAIASGYDACMLVCRPGGRFQVSSELLKRYQPEVWRRTWFATDLRMLPMACGVMADNQQHQR
jgi:HAD superfamily hydrolase (TIGR01549 family)